MQINESIVAAGPDYWRSLDEQVDAPEFRAWLDHEFPVLAGRLIEAESRGPVQLTPALPTAMWARGPSQLTPAFPVCVFNIRHRCIAVSFELFEMASTKHEKPQEAKASMPN